MNYQLLQSIHGICFSRSCLPISETCDYSLLDQERQQWLHCRLVDVHCFLCNEGFTYSSLKVLSKVKIWFSTYLVIPSTLYLGSWILICGFAQEIESISPFCYYFLKMGRFRTQTANFFKGEILWDRCWICGETVIFPYICFFRSWVRNLYPHSSRFEDWGSSFLLSIAWPLPFLCDVLLCFSLFS